MAKQKNIPSKSTVKPVVGKPGQSKPIKAAPLTSSTVPSPDRRFNLLACLGIAVLTFLCMSSSLNNKFTNWDDPGYVINNPVIKDLSGPGIKNIFSTAIMGNYHPLTILTLAIDYKLADLQPKTYHVQSLLWHIATTLMVFFFVMMLTRRRIAGIIAALLFGLHPMHVESVAWVPGRKDVVYGFFYLASCLVYLYYARAELTDPKRRRWYIGAILLFLASILSKPVAVALPLTLLAIDYFEGRLISFTALSKKAVLQWNIIVEKMPYFIVAIGFGIKSLDDQKHFGALLTQQSKFNLVERFALGCYALVTYLWKAVAPIKLLCFYPYPEKVEDKLPGFYFIYPLVVIAIVTLVWVFVRKKKMAMLGIMFFMINIALLLQFLPVGGAILADRYTYIPYLGLMIIPAWNISSFFEPSGNKQYGNMALVGVGVYCCYLMVLSNERCKVWYDPGTLWLDEIQIEPRRAPQAYNNLGFYYYNKMNSAQTEGDRKRYFDSSYTLLTKAIELQPKFVNPYISLGELFRTTNQFDKAKELYYQALAIEKSDLSANAYLGLAIIYSIDFSVKHLPKDSDSALFCYKQTLGLKEYYPEAHSNYANFLDMSGKTDSALVHYTIAMEQNPDIYPPYLNRARAYQRARRYNDAIKDFAMAANIAPENGEVFYCRSKCYYEMGNKQLARQDFQKAKAFGFQGIEPGYEQEMAR